MRAIARHRPLSYAYGRASRHDPPPAPQSRSRRSSHHNRKARVLEHPPHRLRRTERPRRRLHGRAVLRDLRREGRDVPLQGREGAARPCGPHDDPRPLPLRAERPRPATRSRDDGRAHGPHQHERSRRRDPPRPRRERRWQRHRRDARMRASHGRASAPPPDAVRRLQRRGAGPVRREGSRRPAPRRKAGRSTRSSTTT